MEDLARQVEEMEALSAIYGACFCVDSEHQVTVAITDDIQLSVHLPADYPSLSPPTYLLSAPALTTNTKILIDNTLQQLYLDNQGQSLIFIWTEALKDLVCHNQPEAPLSTTVQDGAPSPAAHSTVVSALPAIVSGPSITDRKSTFQAHLARISVIGQVDTVLSELMKNGKVARATHNMLAYRLLEERTTAIGTRCTVRQQDGRDDGETGAGAKLLHLLQLLDADNVVVVVSRWYGGVHLGPDRFRHISNVARDILVDNGFGSKPAAEKQRKTAAKRN